MSIIALDMGDKKIGVAISYSNVSARGLKTIASRNWQEIIDLVKELKISRIVYGVPLKKNQDLTGQAKKIEGQIGRIRERLKKAGLKIQFEAVDETLSTRAASQNLKRKGKDKIHTLSAQILLDQYLSEPNAR